MNQLITESKWQSDSVSSFESDISTDYEISESTLIVLQAECGLINGSRFNCIGTLFATTCHIAFFMDESRETVACAHLDEGVEEGQIQSVLSLFDDSNLKKKEEKEGIDLYLIGGYLDENKTSIKITTKLLTLLSSNEQFQEYNVNLRLLFTGTLNTVHTFIPSDKGSENEVPIPKYQSIGFDVKQKRFVSLEVLSGTQNVPHYILRSAVMFDPADNKRLRVVYNGNDEEFTKHGVTIDEFEWKCPEGLHQCLHLEDAELLEMGSTSPNAEHSEFAKDLRAIFDYVLENQSKDVFKNGNAIYVKNGIMGLESVEKEDEFEEDEVFFIADEKEEEESGDCKKRKGKKQKGSKAKQSKRQKLNEQEL